MQRNAIFAGSLDKRLGFLGTSGSGKTYGAGTLVEEVIAKGWRTVIIDPLGVWWGLRSTPDGAPNDIFGHRAPVIFGGRHGDIAITENAGAIIADAIATTADNAIIDLSEIGTSAAERRFMLAFLKALYAGAHDGAGMHLIIDEADMWAPQRILDKEGDAMKLLGMMETIVRRGRVRGFVPWLISQRPAVLSKNVLSQVDGLAIFNLTSPQDRDAIGDWVKGQADAGEWQGIRASLPMLAKGHALVWLPDAKHPVLERDYLFPKKITFDSSATPKRGQKAIAADLGSIDLGALSELMRDVEEKAKANDPATLKKRIADLEGQAAKGVGVVVNTEAIKAEGYAAAMAEVHPVIEKGGVQMLQIVEWLDRTLQDTFTTFKGMVAVVSDPLAALDEKTKGYRPTWNDGKATHIYMPGLGALRVEEMAEVMRQPMPKLNPEGFVATAKEHGLVDEEPLPGTAAAGHVMLKGSLPPAKVKILVALRQLEAIGQDPADRLNVALFAGVSPNSSGYANNLGAMRTAGLIEYPAPNKVALTDEGKREVPRQQAPTHADLMALLATLIPPAQIKIVKVLASAYPAQVDREALASFAGVSAASSVFANNLGRLRSLGLIDYPAPGVVMANHVLFP